MVDLKPVSVSGYVVTPVDLIIVVIVGVITQVILQYCCYLGLRLLNGKIFLSEFRM